LLIIETEHLAVACNVSLRSASLSIIVFTPLLHFMQMTSLYYCTNWLIV